MQNKGEYDDYQPQDKESAREVGLEWEAVAMEIKTPKRRYNCA